MRAGGAADRSPAECEGEDAEVGVLISPVAKDLYNSFNRIVLLMSVRNTSHWRLVLLIPDDELQEPTLEIRNCIDILLDTQVSHVQASLKLGGNAGVIGFSQHNLAILLGESHACRSINIGWGEVL